MYTTTTPNIYTQHMHSSPQAFPAFVCGALVPVESISIEKGIEIADYWISESFYARAGAPWVSMMSFIVALGFMLRAWLETRRVSRLPGLLPVLGVDHSCFLRLAEPNRNSR